MIEEQKLYDYILLMLGAPVVKIELDKAQLELCFELAKKHLSVPVPDPEKLDETQTKRYELLLREGSLIHAKMILGRIRSKFKSVPGPGKKDLLLDGPALLTEAHWQLEEWKKAVLEFHKK